MYCYHLCIVCKEYYGQVWDKCPKCDGTLDLVKLPSLDAHDFRKKYNLGEIYE